MTSFFGRRVFLTLLGTAAVAGSRGAWGQQSAPTRRLGMLISGAADDPLWQTNVAALLKGLAQLGWVEGRNLKVDVRFGAADSNRIRTAAAELVSQKPDAV